MIFSFSKLFYIAKAEAPKDDRNMAARNMDINFFICYFLS